MIIFHFPFINFNPMSVINSETSSSITRSSTSISITSTDRRKRKRAVLDIETQNNRSNKSHTTYFFRKDTDNHEVTYCIICERKLVGTNKKPYPYSRKGGSTSNLSSHLRDKHGISKYNYLEYLDSNNEVKIQKNIYDFISTFIILKIF